MVDENATIQNALASTDDAAAVISVPSVSTTPSLPPPVNPDADLEALLAGADTLISDMQEISKKEKEKTAKKKASAPAPSLSFAPIVDKPIDFSRVKRTVTLKASFRKPAVTATLREDEIVDESLADAIGDDNMLKVMKRVLEAPEFDRIVTKDQTDRTKLMKLCLPVKSLARGLYCLPMDNEPAVIRFLKRCKTERELLVEELRDAYPQRVKETIAILLEEHGIEVSPEDVPTADEFCGAFSLSWAIVTLDIPSDLAQFDAETFAEEKEKREAAIRAEVEQARQLLRVGTLKVFTHLEKMLRPDEEGRIKSLRQPAIKNLNEFLELFDNKNITNDEALNEMIRRTRIAFGGLRVVKDEATGQERTIAQPLTVTAEEIKKNVTIRGAVIETVKNIKETLGGMVDVVPTRRVIMDED